MDNQKRVFLAYRAVFDGNKAQIRKPKVIAKVVSQHLQPQQNLLKSLGETQVIAILKSLLERGIFASEHEARNAFPDLYITSSAQDAQHTASEADAAKSEAEVLEDIASLDDDNDEGDELEDVGGRESPELVARQLSVTSYKTSRRRLTFTATMPQTTINALKTPSLYPLYIPYKTQHQLLTKIQRLLEECCYEFTSRWMPDLIKQRQWDCPEAIELNKWTRIVVKRVGKLPSHCFGNWGGQTAMLTNILISINKLRHSAVHRLRTTAKSISEMIRSATRFATALGDLTCQEQLDELHGELEAKIRALELNKNFLETRLEQEMENIAEQRRQLDEKEKEVVATMLRDDKDYISLVGGLLSESVASIFDKRLPEAYQNIESEQNPAYETEDEGEQALATDREILRDLTSTQVDTPEEGVAEPAEPSTKYDENISVAAVEPSPVYDEDIPVATENISTEYAEDIPAVAEEIPPKYDDGTPTAAVKIPLENSEYTPIATVELLRHDKEIPIDVEPEAPPFVYDDDYAVSTPRVEDPSPSHRFGLISSKIRSGYGSIRQSPSIFGLSSGLGQKKITDWFS